MGKILTIRLNDETGKRLEHLALTTKRSKSFYIKDMLQKYLEEYEDAFLALERLNTKNSIYYDSDELEKKLEL
jgi:RHH-type rel operon transcriptional repressor/antitoxin RelB